jgi:hypothetical protein
MTRLIQTLVLAVVGLAALAAATPALTRLVGALIPLTLVIGVVAAVLRMVWWMTGPR